MNAASPGLAELTVTVPDGARLAVQVDGPEDAPLLLLLPGQANSHRWWDGLRDDFHGTQVPVARRTVTFDYRGTGGTQAVEDRAWSTRSFAADAAAVLDALGPDGPVDVYGTSMGGRIAQWLAVDRPDLVRRLVLACTTPGGPGALERDRKVRRRLGDPDARARVHHLLEYMYTPAWFVPGPDGARPRSTLLGDPGMTPTATRLHLRVSDGHDASAHLAEIGAPTLVLHGSDDLMAPVENAHLLVEGIPGAELAITDGGRHGFFDEFRATVHPHVLAFLDS